MAIPNTSGAGLFNPPGVGSAGPFQQAIEAQRASAIGDLSVGSGIPADANPNPMGDTIQLGVFSMPSNWVYKHPEEVRAFMGNCIVLRANHSLDGTNIEYIAISPSFKTIPVQCKPRKYQVVLDLVDNDVPAINFKHVADYIKNLRKTPTPQSKKQSLGDRFVKIWSKKASNMKSGDIPLTSMTQNELLAIAAQAMDARSELEKEVAQVRRESHEAQADIYRRQQEAMKILGDNINGGGGIVSPELSPAGIEGVVHKSLVKAIRAGDSDKVEFLQRLLSGGNP